MLQLQVVVALSEKILVARHIEQKDSFIDWIYDTCSKDG
jgi:hypothetical protein